MILPHNTLIVILKHPFKGKLNCIRKPRDRESLGTLGFWVWGLGFRVLGFGFRVWSLGFRVYCWGLGFTPYAETPWSHVTIERIVRPYRGYMGVSEN